MKPRDLDHDFDHHAPPDEKTVKFYERHRAACKEVARKLEEEVPDCREKSLAITKLEEAMLWGNAAVARNGLKLLLACLLSFLLVSCQTAPLPQLSLSDLERIADSRAAEIAEGIAGAADERAQEAVASLRDSVEEVRAKRALEGKSPDDPLTWEEILLYGLASVAGSVGLSVFGINKMRDRRRTLRGERTL